MARNPSTFALGVVLLAASCASPHAGQTAKSPATPRVAVAPRPPPPKVTAPMSGEPDAAALMEARLVQAACEKDIAEQTEARVKEMKAAVDASIKRWRESQPDCWEAARQEYQWRHEYELQN